MVAAPEAVLTELWVSFISLTRSHLAALEITGRLRGVQIDEEPNRLQLRAPIATLNLELDLTRGAGLWTLNKIKHGTSRGQWKLRPDATVVFTAPPQTLDMELAVEQFCSMLMV